MPRPHAPCQPPRSGPSGCGTDERLLFSGPDSFKQLDSAIAGAGIAGTSGKELAGRDGRVIWKVYRDETDELGMRHVFYRQHLLPSGRLAEALGEPYVSEGIPVLGGEIGVHTLADGTPRAVFGRQYREVERLATPALLAASSAVVVAENALQQRGGFSSASRWTADHRQVVLGGTRLVLEELKGRPLTLVWHVPAWDDDEQAHLVRIDAATGEALEVISTASAAVNCTPQSGSQQSIVGYPENTALYDMRYLWATSTPSRPSPWTYEAVKAPLAGWLPGIEVYFQPHTGVASHTPLRCPTETWYGVLPLQPSAGQVLYDNPNMPEGVSGRVAADALWHTYLTVSALKESFARCGFDGHCMSPAQIYIRQPGVGDLGFASHNYNDGWTICGSSTTGCVWVFDRGPHYPRHASASLDVMAHEWGHRLAWNLGLEYNQSTRKELHEGFANVLGHAVEWLNHPPGNGFEKADWCFGEDHNTGSWPSGATCPAYWSRADWFQEVVNNPGGTVSYYSYHEQHRPTNYLSDPHVRGHMLAVVHYLLSAGGKNPICPAAGRGGIPGPWVTTSCHDVSGLGVTKASKILMGVLTWYATPNTQWADLPELAKFVAFDLYSRCWQGPCGFSALWEQAAVRQAFAAIGYDDPTGPIDCGRCP